MPRRRSSNAGGEGRVSSKEIIEQLAEKHDLVHPNGRVNYTAFARRADMPPPTVLRIHQSALDHRIAPETAEKLAAAFSITEQQAMGLEPINCDSAGSGQARKKGRVTVKTPDAALSPWEYKLITELRELTDDDRSDVQQLVSAKLTIRKAERIVSQQVEKSRQHVSAVRKHRSRKDS